MKILCEKSLLPLITKNCKMFLKYVEYGKRQNVYICVILC